MTDFVDDDLVRRQPRPETNMTPPAAPPRQDHLPIQAAPTATPAPVRPAYAPAPTPAPAPVPAPTPAAQPSPRSYTQPGAPVIASPKDAVGDQVASAMKELERLRQQQESLQSQKSDLEEMRRKQQAFEKGRKEMIDALSQSLMTLEKEELKIEQLSGLISSTRAQYKANLNEVEEASEDKWSEETYREELNRALTMIEETRNAYNKNQARISTMKEKDLGLSDMGTMPSSFAGRTALVGDEKPMGYWLKIGFGLSLPFAVVFILVMIVVTLFEVGVF